jgi:hypothetical protein
MWTRATIVLWVLSLCVVLAPTGAVALRIDRQTPCRAFTQSAKDDAAPGADRGVAKADFDQFVEVLRPFMLSRPDGPMIADLLTQLVADVSAWCIAQPDAVLGAVVDKAGNLAVDKMSYFGAAQPIAPTPAAGSASAIAHEAAGLFGQSCLPYAGQVAPLRAWAAGHGLPQVAYSVVYGEPSVTFGVRTPSGPLVLVSSDQGNCHVTAPHGVRDDFQQALIALVQHSGGTIAAVFDRNDPVTHIAQRVYRVGIGQQRWIVSVSQIPSPDQPTQPPRIMLSATLNRSFLIVSPRPPGRTG